MGHFNVYFFLSLLPEITLMTSSLSLNFGLNYLCKQILKGVFSITILPSSIKHMNWMVDMLQFYQENRRCISVTFIMSPMHKLT